MSTPDPRLDDARASVANFLTRGRSYPCSAATSAFVHLADSASVPTLELALEALLPILDSPMTELSERILVWFLLFSLYAPHPISIDPLKSVLIETFFKEREKTLAVARISNGGAAPNEPSVWVLWNILKGEGDDGGSLHNGSPEAPILA
ncbi:hypothetical protein FB451DRAFT_1411873 [Mycena latifolia]|nr:hypothetical protein FB451DRAFT_1411873 [Mycena latifolia]